MKLKKLLITVCTILLCLCMSLAFVACDDDEGKVNPNPDGGDNPTPQEPVDDPTKPKDGNDPNCNHDWSGGWTTVVEKTCTVDGIRSRTCPKCGKREINTQKSNGHNIVDRAGKKATCTEGGYDDYQICTECDFTTYHETPPLDHDMETVPAQAPTCSEGGWEEYERCTRGDYDTLDEHYIPMLAHEYVDDPDHEGDQICKNCGMKKFKPSEGLEFAEAGTIARVTGIGECTDTVVNIPESYNGKPVTEIAENAFSTMKPTNYSEMSQDQKDIIDRKVAKLNAITEINLNSVVRVNTAAFFYMTGLTKVNLGEKLQSIGPQVFSMCTSITEITIPKSCFRIDNDAFFRCDNLSKINIDPANTMFKMIDDKYFVASNTGELKFVCYHHSEDLEHPTDEVITIPEEVKTIGYHAFYMHFSIKEIVIPGTVEVIDQGAFTSCTNLKKVTVKAGVREIRTEAFSSCIALEEFVIESEETTYKDENGNDVEGMTFRTLYKGAFNNCTKLTAITFKGTKAQWKAINHTGNDLLNNSPDLIKLPDNQTTMQAHYTNVVCTDGTLKEGTDGSFNDFGD